MLRGPRSNLYIGQSRIFGAFFHQFNTVSRCLQRPLRQWDTRNRICHCVPNQGKCQLYPSGCIILRLVIGKENVDAQRAISYVNPRVHVLS